MQKREIVTKTSGCDLRYRENVNKQVIAPIFLISQHFRKLGNVGLNNFRFYTKTK